MKPQAVHREHPLYPGYLYRPESSGPHPGILLLHGSEGGFGDFWSIPGEPPFPTGENGYVAKMARHFASLGYVTYAYSYFHADALMGFSEYPPKELADVDLKNTARAFEWLKNSVFVQGRPVGLWGGSRGAEQALILSSLLSQSNSSSLFPDIVVANSPADFVYPGFNLEAAKALSMGSPFPENFPLAWKFGDKLIEMYSAIEVEQIKAPLLITYGAEDPIWGPYVNVYKLHERLTAKGIRSQHFDFCNEENPELLMNSIANELARGESAPRAVFIRFMDEGHSPRPGTKSSLLSSMLTELFLKTYLLR